MTAEVNQDNVDLLSNAENKDSKDSNSDKIKKSLFSSSTNNKAKEAFSFSDATPENMTYSMISECSMISLPSSTKVSSLKGTRLRICHIAEWTIYKQTQAIQTSLKEKEGVLSMFGRKKYSYRTPYITVQGDIPFNPKRGLLGFSPEMCIKVPNTTIWSDTIEYLKGDFGAAGIENISIW